MSATPLNNPEEITELLSLMALPDIPSEYNENKINKAEILRIASSIEFKDI